MSNYKTKVNYPVNLALKKRISSEISIIPRLVTDIHKRYIQANLEYVNN
jgi:hypothetical protein